MGLGGQLHAQAALPREIEGNNLIRGNILW
jgi:hypothetical protein